MPSLTEHTGPLGNRLAAHLLRRLTYTPTISRIKTVAAQSASEAVNALLAPQALSLEQPLDFNSKPWINVYPPTDANITGRSSRWVLKGWWLNEARQDFSIAHKMSFFLHTQFTVTLDFDPINTFDYLALLRHYAVGNIKTLALKMVTNNRMLVYLDNYTNTAANPNVNFSREFFELFTIGKGPQIAPGDYTNYTEQDVEAAGRLLTGYRTGSRTKDIDPDTGIPMGITDFSNHDQEAKTFSHAFNNKTIKGATNEEEMWEELREFVEMIFQQPATAEHLCTKLYRFFIGINITSAIEQDIIKPLAADLMFHNYELLPVLSKLFKSQHFFDLNNDSPSNQIIGGIIKSPLELELGLISFFDVDIASPYEETYVHYYSTYYLKMMIGAFGPQKFNFLDPSAVAGYTPYHQAPAYHRAWFNSESYIGRSGIASRWVGRRTNGINIDPIAFVTKPGNFSDIANPETLVRELVDYIFPEAIDDNRFSYFLNDVFLEGFAAYYWTGEWGKYLATGDTSIVEARLNALISTVIRCQEFQLF